MQRKEREREDWREGERGRVKDGIREGRFRRIRIKK